MGSSTSWRRIRKSQITVSIKEDSLKAALALIQKQSALVVNLLVVGSFLWFLERNLEASTAADVKRAEAADRAAARVDTVSALRISVCHDVQERSNKAVENLTRIIAKQSDSFDRFQEALTIRLSNEGK